MPDALRDQATGLREMFEPAPGLAVLPITAARQGTSFHSLVTNIAAGHARRGRQVIVIDCQARGVAHALGMRPHHDLAEMLSGECPLAEVAMATADGFHILPAQQGIADFVRNAGDTTELFLGFRRLSAPYDVAILAGGAQQVAALTQDQDDLVMVTDPEGEALTAAYADIKRAHAEHGQHGFRVVLSRVDDEQQGLAAFRRLAQTARRFLGVRVEYGGSVPRDAAFVTADRAQCSVYGVAAASAAAQRISQLVEAMQAWRLGRYALGEH